MFLTPNFFPRPPSKASNDPAAHAYLYEEAFEFMYCNTSFL